MVATQKLPQILQLNPTGEIVFQGPFDHVVTSYLELKNPSTKRVCFKVKTTAPRRYCVRPNSGIIEPDGKIKIAIMLQPMDADSQAERSKHKFMVQSTIIRRDDDTISLDDIWLNAAPDEIMDSKLRCVFHTTTPDQEKELQSSTGSMQKNDGTDVPSKPSSYITTSSVVTTTTNQYQMEQPAQQSDRASPVARSVNEPTITTSTPVVSRAISSTTKLSLSGSAQKRQTDTSGQKFADKSVASSHNLTSSFLQPMSDDYKIILVSLAMLILGVILGKYII